MLNIHNVTNIVNSLRITLLLKASKTTLKVCWFLCGAN